MPFPIADGTPSPVLEELLGGPAAALTAVALVVAPGARASGWAAQAAVALAQRWQGPRRLLLADLDLTRPTLHEVAGVSNDEGVVDVVEYGVSIGRLIRSVGGGAYDLLPAGLFAPEPGSILRHDGWTRVLMEVAARRGTLLAWVPADADGVEAVVERAGAVVVLAESDEARAVVDRLAHPYAVLAILTPEAPPAAAAMPDDESTEPAVEVVESKDEVVEPESEVVEPESDADSGIPDVPADAVVIGASAAGADVEDSAPAVAEADVVTGGEDAVETVDTARDGSEALDRGVAETDLDVPRAPREATEPPADRAAVAPEEERASIPAADARAADTADLEAAALEAAASPAAEGEPERPAAQAESETPGPDARAEDDEFDPNDPADGEALILELRDRQRAARLAGAAAAAGAAVATGAAGATPAASPPEPGPAAHQRRAVSTPPPPVPRFRRPIVWTIGVVLLASLLAGAWHLLGGRFESPAAVAAPEPAPPPPAAPVVQNALPFVVVLEAHRDLAAAWTRVADLAEMEPGLLFHIEALEREGTLFYHVMAGPVADSTAALALRDTLIARGHKTAPTPTDVRATPLAFLIGDYGTEANAAEQREVLRRLDIPAYVLRGEAADGQPLFRLYVGGFATEAEAGVMGQMLRAAGIRDTLVARTGTIAGGLPNAAPEPTMTDSLATRTGSSTQ